MNIPARIAAMGLALLAAALPIAAQDQPAADARQSAVQEVARSYTQDFYRGELEKIHGQFSAEMKESVTLQKLTAIHQQLVTRFGKEAELLGEDLADQGDVIGYRRTARFEEGTVLEVLWAVRPDGEIAGFFIRQVEGPTEAPTD